MNQDTLKNIPSVNVILELSTINELVVEYSHELITNSVRKVLEQIRNSIISNDLNDFDLSHGAITTLVIQDIKTNFSPTLQPSINATGIILHTNLGRAPISKHIIEQVVAISNGYSTLEIDAESGERSSRYNHLRSIITFLTGAEDALLVNNNAAAVLLVLDTIAKGKEVIISRSQLVEIGGSFRMPDVMEKGGAILVEVGTTNKTYISDYKNAISERTGLILVVHPSNFRIVGFTDTPDIKEIAALGLEYNIPTFYDLGSGAMIDFKHRDCGTWNSSFASDKHIETYQSTFCNLSEPTVKESVLSGIDLTSFSTDKLLGGPQGGLIIGKKQFIDECKRNPLLRALRVDKTTIALLDATLRLYLDKEKRINSIPVLKMIFTPIEEIICRAKKLQNAITDKSNGFYEIEIIGGFSEIGGGAMPKEQIPSKLLAIRPKKISPNDLTSKLRLNNPPIFTRIEHDVVLFDLRTVIDETEEKEIVEALKKIECNS